MKHQDDVKILMNAKMRKENMPTVKKIRKGCLEFDFGKVTPSEAKALLAAYHSGQLKQILEEVSRQLIIGLI